MVLLLVNISAYMDEPGRMARSVRALHRLSRARSLTSYLIHLQFLAGSLFHIDFGYILGRDPKPFPPPMKLGKEMVEAMGGADSRLYERFRLLCCEAFNILRASSNLILNLLILMVDAGVADLKGEQDVLKVMLPSGYG